MVLFQKMVDLLPVILILVGFPVFSEGYGAKGVESATGLTIEQMLNYAIQDEYLARSEYELIMRKFGIRRPFNNIIRAEEKHILWVSNILKKYGYTVPADTSKDQAVLPVSLKAALEIGEQAEIENIAMYEKFLSRKDLPADVRQLFLELQNGSRNHLRAFQNNLKRNN